jgi:hypothetical protein
MSIDALTIVLLGFITVALVTFVDLNFRRTASGRPALKHLSHLGSRGRTRQESLLIVPSRGNNVWLPASGTDRKPAMSVNGHWYVRNMTSESVRFTRAFILQPPAEGDSVLVRPPESSSFGNHSIDPGSTSEVLTRFWVQPAVCGLDDDFSATVVFVDQLANKHAVENVRFRCWPH